MRKPTFSGRKSFYLLIILIIFLSIVLSACGIGYAKSDITVYPNEYQQTITITISADQMSLIGGPRTFEGILVAAVNDAQNEGKNITWRDISEVDSGTYRYEVVSEKTAYTNSDIDGFSWEEVNHRIIKTYLFTYSDIDLFLNMYQSMTITLHAGLILDSNGTKLDSHTVTWVDPSVIPYAVVIPKGGLFWVFLLLALVLVIIVGILLIVISIIGLSFVKKPTP